MTLREYVDLLRRQWLVVALLTLLGGVAAIGLTLTTTPTYVSQSSILITMSGASTSGGLVQGNDVTTQRAATYASLGTSQFVLQAAATATGADAQDLGRAVTVVARDGQAFLDVTATATTAAQAQAWSQAVADRLVVAAVQSDQIGVNAGLALQIVTPAALPDVAVSPRPRNNTVIGAAVGLILGVCVVVVRNSFDDRVHRSRDVAQLGRVTSGSAVPAGRGRGKAKKSTPAREEAYRRLHATLHLAGLDAGPIAVSGISSTSPVHGATEGLARSMAGTDRTVVVVDVDGGGGRARSSSGGAQPPEAAVGSPGLAQLLTGDATLDEALDVSADGSIAFLSRGAASGGDAPQLPTLQFEALITDLVERFDHLLISCPPPGARAETLLAAGLSRTVVLVAEQSRTTTTQLTDALDVLQGVGLTEVHVLLDDPSARPAS